MFCGCLTLPNRYFISALRDENRLISNRGPEQTFQKTKTGDYTSQVFLTSLQFPDDKSYEKAKTTTLKDKREPRYEY